MKNKHYETPLTSKMDHVSINSISNDLDLVGELFEEEDTLECFVINI